MNIHLAIDLGSESGRAIVGYVENGELHTEEIYRFRTQFMQIHGKSVRNFYRYHEEIVRAMQICAQRYGPALYSIGVDAWGGDFVLLNRTGDICRMPKSYRSQAVSADAAALINEKIGEWEIYKKNGNMKMPTDTLSQLVRLREKRDPSMDDPRGLLFVADAFHYFLGAEPCCEHSLASYGRFFNRAADIWDTEILAALDIPQSICGKIVRAGDTIGIVDPHLCREAGLCEGVRIITPCSHDTACAALAVPDMGSDWAFISSGTWSLLGMETDAPVLNRAAFEANLSNSTMPLMTNMFKKNITGTWIIQQCKSVWGQYSYDDLVNLAEQAPEEDLLVDVNATRFYAPEDMTKAVAGAVWDNFGVAVDPRDAGRVSRIVFQSMAMRYRYYLDRLLQACGKKITKIYILGGGSKNRLINSFTASATGYPVYTGVCEASSTGNLLLQAYGSGELKDKAQMREVVCKSHQSRYFPVEQPEKWKRKYEIFLTKAAKQNQW